jgi:hypothetical protein
MQTEIRINKQEVFTEAARQSAYLGSRSLTEDDPEAYTRIGIDEEDAELLENYWQEGKRAALSAFRRLVFAENESGGVWAVVFDLSPRFPSALKDGLQGDTAAYLTTYIVGRWYMTVNREQAEGTLTLASTYLESAYKKALTKTEPAVRAEAVRRSSDVRLTVSVDTGRVLDDIMVKTAVAARLAELGEKGFEGAALHETDTKAPTLYALKRSLTTALAAARAYLDEYLTGGTLEADNGLESDAEGEGTVLFAFDVPANFNPSASDAVAAGIHDSLVDAVLADWCAMTAPDNVEYHAARSTASLASARAALFKRTRYLRGQYKDNETRK